jgi:hypothetical protein
MNLYYRIGWWGAVAFIGSAVGGLALGIGIGIWWVVHAS